LTRIGRGCYATMSLSWGAMSITSVPVIEQA
jgi:hypothetical protein